MTKHHDQSLYHCRVCGYKHLDFPWGSDGRTPSFEICDCCGVEFGYEDSTRAGIRAYRERWLAEGAPWFDPKQKPAGWTPEVQLQGIPVEFI